MSSYRLACSLPPSVEGQVRCFVELSISKIRWKIVKPPTDSQIQVWWWGETTSTLLRPPYLLRNASSNVQNYEIVRYPIQCGPKQFASYLKDMGPLLLLLVTGPSLIQIGEIKIPEIINLSPKRSIKRSFPIVSTSNSYTSPILGHIQISISFKSLSESTDLSSPFIPCTDIETSAAEETSNYLKSNKKLKNKLKKKSKSKQLKQSMSLENTVVRGTPKRNVSFVVGPGNSFESMSIQGKKTPNATELFDPQPTTAKNMTNDTSNEKERTSTSNMSPFVDQSTLKSVIELETRKYDVLSALLERGQKLRDQMAVSAMTDTTEDLPPVQSDDIPMMNNIRMNDVSDDTVPISLESKAVELVLGDRSLYSQMRDIDEDVSYSEHSDMEDPIHDESLLAELFYGDKEPDENHIVVNDVSNIPNGETENPSTIQADSSPLNEDVAATSIKEKAKSEEHQQPEQDNHERSTEFPLHNSFKPMSLGHVTALARVSCSRVIITDLHINDDVWNDAMSSIVYFIEYKFPISSSSISSFQNGKEITRIVSRNASSNVVHFNHRSMFPILFNEETISYWWKHKLVIEIYARPPDESKPKLFGCCKIPLQELLLSSEMKIEGWQDIFIVTDTTTKKKKKSEKFLFGKLNLSLKLISNKLDSNEIEKPKHDNIDVNATSMQNRDKRQHSSKVIDSPRKTTIRNVPTIEDVQDFSSTQDNSRVADHYINSPTKIIDKHSKVNYQRNTLHNTINEHDHDILDDSGLYGTIYSFIEIPYGRNVSLSPFDPRDNLSNSELLMKCNSYIKIRMFWCDDSAESSVQWETINPLFGLKHTIPVLLNTEFLRTAKNNFFVVEVRCKMLNSKQDQLVGIVKIPLHQVYLSLKSSQITQSILKSMYPVIAVNGLCNIINPLTQLPHGSIKVTVAFGTQIQVLHLANIQNSKNGRNEQNPIIASTKNSDEQIYNQRQPRESLTSDSNYVEHILDVAIHKVKGTEGEDDEVWGETDCFIQYQFPKQSKQTDETYLETYRTETALCIPTTAFRYEQRHSFRLSSSTSFERFILDMFGPDDRNLLRKNMSSGVPFELWKRFYHPNIREQLIGKGVLPLAKLCAMVAMNKSRNTQQQQFNIPLFMHGKEYDNNASTSNVTMSVTYKRLQAQHPVTKMSDDIVCLSVLIERICGLKAAALHAAKKDDRLTYAAACGINPYVQVWPSFATANKSRSSKSLSKIFSPSFNYHVDFPLHINSSGDNMIGHNSFVLAECLETNYINVEVMHQISMSPGFKHNTIGSDVCVAVAKIPLIELLRRKSGVKGWWPLMIPEMQNNARSECNSDISSPIVGGIEVVINLGNQGDREKIINIGRSSGWSPLTQIEMDQDDWYTDYEVNQTVGKQRLTINVDSVWVPLDVLKSYLDASLTNTGSLQIYCRLKFYDRSPICSKARSLNADSEMVSCKIDFSKTYEVGAVKSLAWYLSEEHLEVQFWLTSIQIKDTDAVLCARDQLIGCAHVDMFSLGNRNKRNPSLSGMYQLYKAGVDDMRGCTSRISISISNEDDCDSRTITSTNSTHQHDKATSHGTSFYHPSTPEPTLDSVDVGIPTHFHIECVYHLPLSSVPNGKGVYATYSFNNKVIYTDVIPLCENPKWNFKKQEALNMDDKPNEVTFSVWITRSESFQHSIDRDPLIGKATIDLSSLYFGLRQIFGWYNIVNFDGHAQGQIKIGIVPSQSVCQSPPKSVLSYKPLKQLGLPFSENYNLAMQPLNHEPDIQETNQSTHFTQVDIRNEQNNTEDHLRQHLRKQLQDLEIMTTKLQTRSQINDPNYRFRTLTPSPPPMESENIIQRPMYGIHVSGRNNLKNYHANPHSDTLKDSSKKDLEHETFCYNPKDVIDFNIEINPIDSKSDRIDSESIHSEEDYDLPTDINIQQIMENEIDHPIMSSNNPDYNIDNHHSTLLNDDDDDLLDSFHNIMVSVPMKDTSRTGTDITPQKNVTFVDDTNDEIGACVKISTDGQPDLDSIESTLHDIKMNSDLETIDLTHLSCVSTGTVKYLDDRLESAVVNTVHENLCDDIHKDLRRNEETEIPTTVDVESSSISDQDGMNPPENETSINTGTIIDIPNFFMPPEDLVQSMRKMRQQLAHQTEPNNCDQPNTSVRVQINTITLQDGMNIEASEASRIASIFYSKPNVR